MTASLATEEATKYLTKTIPKTSPIINLMPITANEINCIKNQDLLNIVIS
jgi:hypothetical protein